MWCYTLNFSLLELKRCHMINFIHLLFYTCLGISRSIDTQKWDCRIKGWCVCNFDRCWQNFSAMWVVSSSLSWRQRRRVHLLHCLINRMWGQPFGFLHFSYLELSETSFHLLKDCLYLFFCERGLYCVQLFNELLVFFLLNSWGSLFIGIYFF